MIFMKKLLKWIALIFVALVVIGVIADSLKSPEQKAADAAKSAQAAEQRAEQERQQAIQEAASLPTVTAHDIAVAYAENTVAADQKFKGKKFKVSGTVSDINTDFSGDPYLTLRGGVNQFMEPHFGFDKAALNQLASLKKGSKVTLVCTGRGDIAKTPMSGECSLVK